MRRLFITLIVLVMATPVHAVNLSAAYMNETLTRGLSASEALNLLELQYPAARDRAYLETLRAGMSGPAVVPRSYRPIAQGYEITAPNGRVFTITARAKTLFVNQRRIEGKNLERDLRATQAALKASFVARLWNVIIPEAAAKPGVVDAVAIIALAIASWWWTTKHFGGAEDFNEITSSLGNVLKLCEQRKGDPAFEGSQKAMLLSLRAAKVIRGDAAEQTEDCASVTARALVGEEKLRRRPARLSVEQRDAVCVQLKHISQCFTESEARMAKPAAKDAPVTGQ